MRLELEVLTMADYCPKCENTGWQGIVGMPGMHGACECGRKPEGPQGIFVSIGDPDEEPEWRRFESSAKESGDWICDKCGYVESRRTLNADTGAVGVDATPALPCPNDGQYLRRCEADG